MALRRQKEKERVEERARVQYLHSLRLVHGFDCILCHSSGGKRDKRTSCREGRGEEEGGMEGQWRGGGGGQKGRRRRRRRRGDKKEQKQDKRVGHVVVIKKPKQRLIQRTAHRQTTVFSVAVETTAEKRKQCHDKPTTPHLAPSPSHHLTHPQPPQDI